MIWSLQVLRFVAALMVVYAHAAMPAFSLTGSSGLVPQDLQIIGRAGVDIFFVISGVIIAKTSVGLTWQEFAWRRWRRVVPIYFVVCIPASLVLAGPNPGWRDVLASFLLWPATDVMTKPLLSVAWTLCFEVLFYAMAALVLWNRRSLYVVLGLYGLAMLLRPIGPVFQFLGNPIIIEFLMGVVISQLPKWPVAKWGLIVGAAMILLAGPMGFAPQDEVLDLLIGDDNGLRLIGYGIPAALIVFGTMQFEARPSFWTRQGDASYALYLTHVPVILFGLVPLWDVIHPTSPDLIIVLTLLVCGTVGWMVHVWIEKPLLKALRPAPRPVFGAKSRHAAL